MVRLTILCLLAIVLTVVSAGRLRTKESQCFKKQSENRKCKMSEKDLPSKLPGSDTLGLGFDVFGDKEGPSYTIKWTKPIIEITFGENPSSKDKTARCIHYAPRFSTGVDPTEGDKENKEPSLLETSEHTDFLSRGKQMYPDQALYSPVTSNSKTHIHRYSKTSNVFTETASHMGAQVDISGGKLITWDFHAQGQFQNNFREAMRSDSQVFEARYSRDIYRLSLFDAECQTLSSDFKTAIEGLKSEDKQTTEAQYRDILNKFGSHYITSVKMGGLCTIQITAEKSETEMVKKDMKEFQAKGGIHALLVKVDAKGGGSGSESDGSDAIMASFESSMTCSPLGNEGDDKNVPDNWLKSVQNNPTLLKNKMKVSPIWEVPGLESDVVEGLKSAFIAKAKEWGANWEALMKSDIKLPDLNCPCETFRYNFKPPGFFWTGFNSNIVSTTGKSFSTGKGMAVARTINAFGFSCPDNYYLNYIGTSDKDPNNPADKPGSSKMICCAIRCG